MKKNKRAKAFEGLRSLGDIDYSKSNLTGPLGTPKGEGLSGPLGIPKGSLKDPTDSEDKSKTKKKRKIVFEMGLIDEPSKPTVKFKKYPQTMIREDEDFYENFHPGTKPEDVKKMMNKMKNPLEKEYYYLGEDEDEHEDGRYPASRKRRSK